MALVKTKGVIIKVQDYKENDKLLWMYTEELGKVTCIAKGAKRSKSQLLSVTLPLCFGEYLLFKGKNLYNLQEGKIINSFQGLLNNLEKLTYSSYLCELIDICVESDETNATLFKEFMVCLYLLNTDVLDYELLVRAFELRLLEATGYNLELDKCCICKNKIAVADYISLSHYGGVCDECDKEYGFFISKPAYNALRFLKNTPMDKVYRLNVNNEIKKQMERVITNIIANNYSKKPKSLEMLSYIKE